MLNKFFLALNFFVVTCASIIQGKLSDLQVACYLTAGADQNHPSITFS